MAFRQDFLATLIIGPPRLVGAVSFTFSCRELRFAQGSGHPVFTPPKTATPPAGSEPPRAPLANCI